MNKDKYQDAVKACALAAQFLMAHDLEGILEAIERCDAFAPVLDPTLYIKNSKAMHEDKEILEAAIPLKAIGEKLFKYHIAQQDAMVCNSKP